MRKPTKIAKARACTGCGKPSNPLSLYRGFFTGWAGVGGWYHRDCLVVADYHAALDILISASGGVQ